MLFSDIISMFKTLATYIYIQNVSIHANKRNELQFNKSERYQLQILQLQRWAFQAPSKRREPSILMLPQLQFLQQQEKLWNTCLSLVFHVDEVFSLDATPKASQRLGSLDFLPHVGTSCGYPHQPSMPLCLLPFS